MRARDVLGPGSPLRERFARYEDRPGQVAMAEAVEDALEAERALFVEAGTGTGKTLAYLVPAILSGKKVVISTATKALQEQIYLKDIPLLADALAEHGVRFRAAMMKGLSNYVCKRRLSELIASTGGGTHSALSRVLSWVGTTEAGDRAEAAGIAEDDGIWREVVSSTETRIGQECRFFDECFVTRMRRRAEDADVVVVNHHLFFADLALRGGPAGSQASAIPAYDAVIFDEAHQLEDIATDFFGSRVSLARIEALVRDATRTMGALGLLGDTPKESRVATLLDQVGASGHDFFHALDKSGGGLPRGIGRRPLGPADYDTVSKGVHGKLDASLEALAHHADAHVARGEAVALVARRARDLRESLRAILDGALVTPDPDEETPEERRIAWLEVGPRTVSLGASPIALGGMLRRSLWDRTKAVVCTSATLATSGGASPSSFHFVRARLGAPPEARELIVPSPFDFPTKAALYVARDLPEPADPAFDAAALDRIVDLITITKGGAFVLCTSNRAMKRLHNGLVQRWKGDVFVQGEAPKQALLERFRDKGDAVLVATMSFWEGVDVPGRALRLVVMDKIPFAVPSDPVVAARSAEVDRQGGNSFAEYSVPAAAITLKQGFGRLLRTQDDAGIVAILDGRLVRKGYGKRLLASLPPARRISSIDDLRVFWDHLGAADA